MKIEVHIYDHRANSGGGDKISEILKLVIDNNLKIQIMNENLVQLETEVSETKTVMASAVVLIKGIAAKLKEAGTDKAKLDELRNSLDTGSNELAAAVAENTAAEETPTDDEAQG